jgi:hypothetical protein
VFSYHFDLLILKIIFKNKKIYYFNIFLNKKHFKNNRNYTLKPSHIQPSYLSSFKKPFSELLIQININNNNDLISNKKYL